jgi:hypothetical protein
VPVESLSPQPTSIIIEQVVIRCGCSDPESHASQGLPCPTPRSTEDLGVTAEWHATDEQPTPPPRISGLVGRIRRHLGS